MTQIESVSDVPSNALRQNVLVADPMASPGSDLIRTLVEEGCHVILAETLAIARRYIEFVPLSYVLTELRFEDGDAFQLIGDIADRHPDCRTIVHTSYCDVRVAVRSVQAGADDIYPKPMDANALIALLLGKCTRTTPDLKSVRNPKDLRHDYIRQTYLLCGANLTKTANHLSLQRRTLQRIMSRQPEPRGLRESAFEV
jgi:two-component system, response regulator RegA